MTDAGDSAEEPAAEPTLPTVFTPHAEAVARGRDVDAAALRATLAEMQRSVQEYPGVADLVFEYRFAFSHDPLVERDGDTYLLLVPPRVWPEFGGALGVDDAMLAAMRAVHSRAFDDAVGELARGDWEPLVVVAD
ncbi:hypothetical protein [Halobaculum sp. P14]|uniref:hypothetical protein n=1 Tax=Halobaculum sp. P14 TaxID=3421638 RepID=UPI003EB8162F